VWERFIKIGHAIFFVQVDVKWGVNKKVDMSIHWHKNQRKVNSMQNKERNNSFFSTATDHCLVVWGNIGTHSIPSNSVR